jgi:hypothetical protein
MRRKSIKSLFMIVLTVTFTLACIGIAYASTSYSSTLETTVYGHKYKFYAQASNDSSDTWAYTIINTSDGTTVPTGYMGAYAGVYDSSNNLKTSGSWYFNPVASSSCIQDSGLYATNGTYYAMGYVKFYNGSDYSKDYVTTKSPYISNRMAISAYEVNENGETYGCSGANALAIGEEPDLISSIGSDGTLGYVRATELYLEEPNTPEEAVAISQQNINGRSINLYEKDGVTIIGTFEISAHTN